jgi:hypothetical protein
MTVEFSAESGKGATTIDCGGEPVGQVPINIKEIHGPSLTPNGLPLNPDRSPA